MKVLGVVQWTTRDKVGHPIAGVLPVVEIQQTDWRPIDPAEEFPSQGQVFWPNAQGAIVGLLITFRSEPNPGQRDEYKAADARPALEVLDLRRYGNPTQVRAALAAGIQHAGPVGTLRALAWCQPDVLVGPVELIRLPDGTLRLTGTNLARVSTFTGARLHRVEINDQERLVRADDAPPSGYVDWDDDETVLRRALEAAVRFAKQDGHDTGQTKKQIEIAAQALASRGIGAEAQLDRYRLERALSLCVDEESVSGLAPKLIDLLRDHPAIRAELDELSATVRGDLERSTRTEVEQRLAREQNAFNETLEAHASTLCELEAAQRQLDEQKKELDALQSKCEKATAEIEAAERQLEQRKGELEALQSKSEQAILEAETAERRLEQWKKELEVLRSNAVTDAAAMVAGSLDPDRASHLHWSNRRGESLRDRAALQRALTDASRKWELSSILVYEV